MPFQMGATIAGVPGALRVTSTAVQPQEMCDIGFHRPLIWNESLLFLLRMGGSLFYL